MQTEKTLFSSCSDSHKTNQEITTQNPFMSVQASLVTNHVFCFLYVIQTEAISQLWVNENLSVENCCGDMRIFIGEGFVKGIVVRSSRQLDGFDLRWKTF